MKVSNITFPTNTILKWNDKCRCNLKAGHGPRELQILFTKVWNHLNAKCVQEDLVTNINWKGILTPSMTGKNHMLVAFAKNIFQKTDTYSCIWEHITKFKLELKLNNVWKSRIESMVLSKTLQKMLISGETDKTYYQNRISLENYIFSNKVTSVSSVF